MKDLQGMDLSLSLLIGEEFTSEQPIGFWFYLLRKLPLICGLVPLDPPILFEFPSLQVPTESGVTGIMVMVQSHVAFHWWPESRFLHLTISSCKQFNVDGVMGLLANLFPVKETHLEESRWS